MKILLFADPGIDDSIAIIYALLHSEIEVMGIGTGDGNVSVFGATKNSAYLLERTCRKIGYSGNHRGKY
ncbi:nucleoside hydrolase [Sutcliffiella horikoshii]|uniref:nucleoside hydrolase n=1 Tax=Sutcliffiella horikoshii TaxID=79883 RepID=UPI001CFD00D7|nr:nucleoside hydrolase [Sutcliffiella horikoshii]